MAKAARLFSLRGFGQMTMKRLAQECGITEPAIYRYFESKEALYEAVLRSLQERLDLRSLMARLGAEDDPERLLRGVAEYIVQVYSQSPELPRLLFHSRLEGHPLAGAAFKALRQPFVDLVADRLSAMVSAGRIRPIHPEITARCFVGMTMDCALGLHLWKEVQGRSYDPQLIIDNNVGIYAAGLRPASTNQVPPETTDGA